MGSFKFSLYGKSKRGKDTTHLRIESFESKLQIELLIQCSAILTTLFAVEMSQDCD
jgi:hypothetical protein